MREAARLCGTRDKLREEDRGQMTNRNQYEETESSSFPHLIYGGLTRFVLERSDFAQEDASAAFRGNRRIALKLRIAFVQGMEVKGEDNG